MPFISLQLNCKIMKKFMYDTHYFHALKMERDLYLLQTLIIECNKHRHNLMKYKLFIISIVFYTDKY